MKKEIVTMSHIQQDLIEVAKYYRFIAVDYSQNVVIGGTIILAIFVGLMLIAYPLRGWIVFLPGTILIGLWVLWHVIRWVRAHKQYKVREKEIKAVKGREELHLSVEQLKRIQTKTVFYPSKTLTVRSVGFGRRAYRNGEVSVYHFESGGTWWLAYINYYQWSKEWHLSFQGLENISIPGDEFICVTLPGYNDAYIKCIYPCKYFILDEKLRETR